MKYNEKQFESSVFIDRSYKRANFVLNSCDPIEHFLGLSNARSE